MGVIHSSHPILSSPLHHLGANTSTTLFKNDFDSESVDSEEMDGDHRARKRRNKQAWDDGVSDAPMEQPLPDSKVKIALSLYKVQQNIYLLDFQRVEVSLSKPGSSRSDSIDYHAVLQ